MSRKRSKTSSAAARSADARNTAASNGAANVLGKPGNHNDRPKTWSALFSQVAGAAARYAGHPLTFLTAVTLVVLWALTGPWFGYSDTWQLVINTTTTIVTFLMVFLIQHTQNRDTLAVQLKLAELIIAARQAENRVATIEDLSEDELEELHEQYRMRAETALDHLNRRRAQLKKAS
jgi:low affinity Fe/Cu permease